MSATLVLTEPSLESDCRPTLAGRLSRRMSSGRYMPEVDGVRFLAIGIVLAVHLFAVAGLSSGRLVIVPPFGPIIAGSTRDPGLVAFLQYGHVGVYLFFILSGFVLALPFIRWRVMGAKGSRCLRTSFGALRGSNPHSSWSPSSCSFCRSRFTSPRRVNIWLRRWPIRIKLLTVSSARSMASSGRSRLRFSGTWLSRSSPSCSVGGLRGSGCS